MVRKLEERKQGFSVEPEQPTLAILSTTHLLRSQSFLLNSVLPFQPTFTHFPTHSRPTFFYFLAGDESLAHVGQSWDRLVNTRIEVLSALFPPLPSSSTFPGHSTATQDFSLLQAILMRTIQSKLHLSALDLFESRKAADQLFAADEGKNEDSKSVVSTREQQLEELKKQILAKVRSVEGGHETKDLDGEDGHLLENWKSLFSWLERRVGKDEYWYFILAIITFVCDELVKIDNKENLLDTLEGWLSVVNVYSKIVGAVPQDRLDRPKLRASSFLSRKKGGETSRSLSHAREFLSKRQLNTYRDLC